TMPPSPRRTLLRGTNGTPRRAFPTSLFCRERPPWRSALLAPLILIVLALSLVVRTAALADEPEGRKMALLVGVKKYKKEELSDLKFTENDVTELAELLRQGGYRRVVVLTQKAGAADPDLLPTGENIRDSLRGLLKGLRPRDSVLLAFSGHGVQFQGEKEHYF